MKNLREELKKLIIENADNIDMLGVRSDWRDLELGYKLENSYQWNHERDCSSYYTDDPIELPGTCATLCEISFSLSYLDSEDEEEVNGVIDKIIDAYEYNKSRYDGIQYLVAGMWNDPESLACDMREVILKDATVLFKF